MTTQAQTAANRANAKRSTGPKSVSGKARIARNAVRHGATRAPDPEQVMDWFCIIIGVSDLAVADIHKDDDTTRLALRLAGAEVRLTSAQAALDEFQASPNILTRLPDVRRLVEDESEHRATLAGLPPGVQTDDEIEAHIERHIAMARKEYLDEFKTRTWISRELRLLRRYLREAQSHRNRAFNDWIEHLTEIRAGPNNSTATGQIV